MEIDTANKYMVGAQGNGFRILVPVHNQFLPLEDAVNLAAWLVAVSGVSDEEFREVVEKVRNA